MPARFLAGYHLGCSRPGDRSDFFGGFERRRRLESEPLTAQFVMQALGAVVR